MTHMPADTTLFVDYHNAVFHYTLAIETARSELVMTDDDSVKRQLASLYSNRAAASTMLRQYHEALVDCDAAIQADESYGKAYLRKAQLQLMNGLLHDAIATCDTVIAMDPESDKARDERINILAIQTKYTQSKEFVEKLRQDKQHMPREYTLERSKGHTS
jgi:tetratricopeptide (TPR) repeat protein